MGKRIEAKDLRVGNWIRSILLDRSPHRVDLFFFHELYDHEDAGDGTMLDYYVGIPLTPEILQKAGLRLDVNFFVVEGGEPYCKGYTCLRYSINNRILTFARAEGDGDNCDWERISLKIDYLHQFQNAYFLLMGRELEITL